MGREMSRFTDKELEFLLEAVKTRILSASHVLQPDYFKIYKHFTEAQKQKAMEDRVAEIEFLETIVTKLEGGKDENND
jgi:hypothetical protein